MTVVLDAGALIAVERGDRTVVALLERARAQGVPVLVPVTAWAQVWRGGARQVLLSRFRRASQEPFVAFAVETADRVGSLLGRTGTSDVVDAHVVVVAQAHEAVVLTSDPDDLRALDPALRLVTV